jgi:uncharacterized membrane protein YbhN (UPF0104 family)
VKDLLLRCVHAIKPFVARHSGLLKYALGLSVLAAVIWKYWDLLGQMLQEPVQPGMLAIAFGLYLLGVVMTFVRWYILVRAQEMQFTLWNALRLGMLGFFLSTFLPGSIGGDVIKAAFLAKEQSRRTVAVATVLIDRVIGLWGLFWLVTILGSLFWVAGDPALRTKPSLQLVFGLSATVVVVSVLVWILMGMLPEWRAQRFAGRLSNIPKVGHSAAEFWRALWMYRAKSGAIALSLGLSLIGQIGFVLGFYYSAQFFLVPAGETIPSMGEHFLVVPIGMTVAALFPSPGGVGGGEYGFGALYFLVIGTEASKARGVLASLVYRCVSSSLSVLGFLIYLATKPSASTGKEPPPEETGESKNGFFNGEAKVDEAKNLPAELS